MKTLISSLKAQKPKSLTQQIKKFAPKKSNQSYKKLQKTIHGLAFQSMVLSFQSADYQYLFKQFAEDLIQLSKICQLIALNQFMIRFSEKLVEFKWLKLSLSESESVAKNAKKLALIIQSIELADAKCPKWVAIGKAEEWLGNI